MAKQSGRRIGMWVLMGFLAIGLVGFGATGLSGSLRSIGTVGDKSVPVQRYTTALTEQLRALEAQLGNRVPFPMAQSLGIDRAVLARVVADRALDNEATQLGLSIGDARVAAQIRTYPAFQGLGGSFDRDTYRFVLEQNRLTEAEFESQIRDDLTRSLLQAAVVGGIPADPAFGTLIAAYVGERRDPTWIELTAADLTGDLPAPSEDDLLAHYEANPEEFTAPEIRHLTYAWLTPEMLQDEITIEEADLRELYEARISDYVQPERRLVERLVMPDAAAAEAARTRLDAGETDFEALVSARGLDLADTDLGDVARNDLGSAADAVFAAEPGEVLGPLDTSLGPAFFRVNAILAAEEIPFEEAASDLSAELANSRARRILQDRAQGITDMLAGGATIEDLAARTDLVEGKLDWSSGQTEGPAAYDTFRIAAAAATEGAFPELQELADGGLFLLRLDGVTPPALRPFDEVRDAVAASWGAEAARRALLDRAEALAAEIRETGLFRLPGRVATIEDGLIRRSFVAGTPAGFMTEVFSMAEGEVRVLPTETGAVVVRLDGIRPAETDSPLFVAERDSVSDRVAQGIAQDIYAAFAEGVLSRTEVRIDEAALAAIHASFQ